MEMSLVSAAAGVLAALICMGADACLRVRFALLDWGVVALATIAGAFAAA
jgi:hypothetical protein